MATTHRMISVAVLTLTLVLVGGASASAGENALSAALVKRECGNQPDDASYGYAFTNTIGISCHRGRIIATRAKRKFCRSRGDCPNRPETLNNRARGKVRYGRWACRVDVIYYGFSVRCRSGKRFILRAVGS